jgi:hypothetical protein
MIRTILMIACSFIIIACSTPTLQELILFDFEKNAELDQLRWKCFTLFSLSNEHVTHGNRSLRMELYPSDYPGLDPVLDVNDWRKYTAICIDIYNPEKEKTTIFIRIDDQKDSPGYAERYNQRFILKPGLNHIHIPLKNQVISDAHRALNLKKIYRLSIFMTHPQKKYVLYVDNIRLVL